MGGVDSNSWSEPGLDEDGNLLPYTEAEAEALVSWMAQNYAPRRFALCGIVRDDEGCPQDVQILGWGLQINPDSVSFIGRPDRHGNRFNGTFRSVESARRRLVMHPDARIAWSDPEP